MINLSLKQAQVALELLNDIEAEKGGLLEAEEQLQATLEALIDAAKDKQYSPQLAG
ncbi:hypothetical protein ROCKET24_124 [Vibrio phage Rocket24]|uniref:Uncharacterized protein n=1 Tax=Vibrio phage Chester TaxID=2712961 RepID=A0A6G8R581_9CAUD|nr:hypothetical protein KNU88_gp177 [Vibrio phage Chester]QIG66230.1 hypothetical protein CILSICK_127 [Vibrio phage Cilsick]QIN96536.1 hypothetical protein CHESTER_129 [Vibrio phage Chester]WBU77112.1 hypothetical protein NOELLE_124 [Vibrio phage Noelle]WCD55801.1 hypothetical protein ROCKET24_124 [Vibrio phage Rocket24]